MFELVVNTDNAAFEDNRQAEIARILRELAKLMEVDAVLYNVTGDIRDVNGNKVGYWTYRR